MNFLNILSSQNGHLLWQTLKWPVEDQQVECWTIRFIDHALSDNTDKLQTGRKWMTETGSDEPARMSTAPEPLFSLKPLDATTWLRSLLSKVFRANSRWLQSTFSKVTGDTFGTGIKCPYYRESNKGSKERRGPTLGVRFTEMSVLRKCPLRESRLYICCEVQLPT